MKPEPCSEMCAVEAPSVPHPAPSARALNAAVAREAVKRHALEDQVYALQQQVNYLDGAWQSSQTRANENAGKAQKAEERLAAVEQAHGKVVTDLATQLRAAHGKLARIETARRAAKNAKDRKRRAR